MPELMPPTTEPQLDESQIAYPGWKIVLASFFGIMVSFAAIVPYTFGLFIKPLAEAFRRIQHFRINLGRRFTWPWIPARSF